MENWFERMFGKQETAYDNTVLSEEGFKEFEQGEWEEQLTGEQTTKTLIDAILPTLAIGRLGKIGWEKGLKPAWQRIFGNIFKESQTLEGKSILNKIIQRNIIKSTSPESKVRFKTSNPISKNIKAEDLRLPQGQVSPKTAQGSSSSDAILSGSAAGGVAGMIAAILSGKLDTPDILYKLLEKIMPDPEMEETSLQKRKNLFWYEKGQDKGRSDLLDKFKGPGAFNIPSPIIESDRDQNETWDDELLEPLLELFKEKNQGLGTKKNGPLFSPRFRYPNIK